MSVKQPSIISPTWACKVVFMGFQLVKKPFSEIKVKSRLLTMGGRLSAVIDGRERARTAVYGVQQGLKAFVWQQQLARGRLDVRVCPEGLD